MSRQFGDANWVAGKPPIRTEQSRSAVIVRRLYPTRKKIFATKNPGQPNPLRQPANCENPEQLDGNHRSVQPNHLPFIFHPTFFCQNIPRKTHNQRPERIRLAERCRVKNKKQKSGTDCPNPLPFIFHPTFFCQKHPRRDAQRTPSQNSDGRKM